VAKNLLVPLDTKLKELKDLPYTISYVIRKRLQIDNLNELPKEKRPPDKILWSGTPEDLDDWLDKVLPSKKNNNPDKKVYVDLKDVED